MARIKIGVLTFHRCINYGSYWQARCLVEGLRSLGADALLLDHFSRRVCLAEWKCSYRPTLPTAVPRSDMRSYRTKVRKFFDCFEQLPLSKKFRLDAPDESGTYDVVVIGSDEVWNLYHPWYGKCGIFFGEGLRAKRLVSYAASFGNYPCEYGLNEPWSQLLSRFSAISVRDDNSRDLVRTSTGSEPEIVLDPCLQFPLEPDERESIPITSNYAAVYGHNFSPEFITSIRSWARKRNMRLVSIGYRNNWAHKQWLTADPHDFANFIGRAKAVITNFFHGCVFALRNLKPFVCEAAPYRHNKLTSLMNTIGGERHLVHASAVEQSYIDVLDNPLEPSISANIDRLRMRSTRYLNTAIPAQVSL